MLSFHTLFSLSYTKIDKNCLRRGLELAFFVRSFMLRTFFIQKNILRRTEDEKTIVNDHFCCFVFGNSCRVQK